MPPRPSSTQLATAWLAAALILLPWAYRIAWDTSRAIPLVRLSPALSFGRDLVTRRLGRLFSTSTQPHVEARLRSRSRRRARARTR